MDIVILDLEWNAAYSARQKSYLNEIIQFGAVKCAGPDLVQTSSFSCFVRPQVGKRLNPIVSGLTRITDEHLAQGIPFMQAVSQFRRWAGDCLLMTWGPADVLALIENCRYFSGGEQVPFLTRYCDLQRYAQDRMGLDSSEQVGLEKAAGLLGLDLSGKALHRALDDSAAALEVLRRIWNPQAIAPLIEVCDGEFYRRATFKTTYIADLKDPLVQPEHLRFSCPKCGGPARKKSKWGHRNKGFRANFRCTACGYRFTGQLYLKQKYEGIAVTKKTYPLPVIETPRDASPGLVGNMKLELTEGVGVLRFPDLNDVTGVNAAFSTRLGGVSEREFAAMNLGFGRGDPEENVAQNYRLFCAAAGFDPDSLVTGNQDHHTNILRVTAENRGLGVWSPKTAESVDGLCTDDPGVTLVIYCADCVPLYFIDGEHRAIGLAHAGWRGTAAGMAKVMVERITFEFGTDPQKLRAAIGPSICQDCFEVDPPVAKEFLALPHAEKFVFGPFPVPAQDGETAEKYHISLWECNRQFLLEAGVQPGNITVGGVCTMCQSDLLFSHRKTQGRRGSNAAFLSLK